MEILNLVEYTTPIISYYNDNIRFDINSTVYLKPKYINENNYYEVYLDIETSLTVYDFLNETENNYPLYSAYDLKPFIDTYYTTIVDIVNDNGEIIESGADILIPSPELTDIWGGYFDIEIGTSGDSTGLNYIFYDNYDNGLYSRIIDVPVVIDTFDIYGINFLYSRSGNQYFANYWEQIYNQEFIEIGKSEGYFEGLEKGIKQGKEIGIEEGYELGYEVGFGEGQTNRPLTTFGTVIKVISDNASSLLKTEILPNFTISNIIFIPVIFSLLGIVFKFFRR